MAYRRIKQVNEGSDGDVDHVMRSMLEAGGPVSNKSLKDIPALAEENLAAEVGVAIWATLVKL